jgi:hypothetical protein
VGLTSELITALNDAIDRIEAVARRSLDAGTPNSVETLNTTSGIEK